MATLSKQLGPGGDGTYIAAVYLATSIYVGPDDQRGALALVESDGDVEVGEVGAVDNGRVAASKDGRVLVSSDRTTYLLDGTSGREWKRGGVQSTQHWAGFADSGAAVSVFNTGGTADGYTTDVYLTQGDQRVHRALPIVPGPTGLTTEAVWVASAGSDNIDGEVDIYGVPFDGSDVTHAAWRLPVESEEASEASNIFAHDGQLWHLERITSLKENGDYDLGPGGRQIRLAKIQPALIGGARENEVYTSVPLTGGSSYTFDVDAASPVAIGCDTGHLYDGSIYTVDHDSTLWQVGLDSGQMQAVGRLEGLEEVEWANASWNGDTLTLLSGRYDDSPPVLRTYDIQSAELRTSMPVEGLAGVVDASSEFYSWSIAALPQDVE